MSPDVGNTQALEAQVEDALAAERGPGPTAAAASFGVRLKRLLATQTGESTLDGPTGEPEFRLTPNTARN